MAEQYERRLAAVLAGDVVGYSRMMHEDEDATFGQVSQLFAATVTPLVESNGGRVVKTMGDGFIAEFASVLAAFEAGRAILAEIDAPVAMRMGLHVGDIIVTAEGDVLGNGVNVAARLEGLAKPGRIAVSGRAAEELRRKHFELSYLGSRKLKNIAEPVPVYEFGGRRRRFGWLLRPVVIGWAAGLVTALAIVGWWTWHAMTPEFSMEDAIADVPCSWLRISGHSTSGNRDLWAISGFAGLSPEALNQVILDRAIKSGVRNTEIVSQNLLSLAPSQCMWIEKIRHYRYLGVPLIKAGGLTRGKGEFYPSGVEKVAEIIIDLANIKRNIFLYGIERTGEVEFLGKFDELVTKGGPASIDSKNNRGILKILTDSNTMNEGIILLEADRTPPPGLVEKQVATVEQIEKFDEYARRDHWVFYLSGIDKNP